MAIQKILIVDDERATRDAMTRALAPVYECFTASDAEQALALLESEPDVVLMISDVRMPGETGLSLVQKAKALRPDLACLLLTAYGSVDLAVEAMKSGADDFLTKPITDLKQLEMRLAQALQTRSLKRRVRELESKLDEKTGLEAFTGRSGAMEKVYRLVRQTAR
jgi:DNA-binding NtrC family response regulator